MKPREALNHISAEYRRAADKFERFHSFHEGLAVLMEEFEKLKTEVFRKDVSLRQMRMEAIQVGAMAVRFLVDLIDPEASHDP